MKPSQQGQQISKAQWYDLVLAAILAFGQQAADMSLWYQVALGRPVAA